MTAVARPLDDLDRLAFRLTRVVRTQYPHLQAQGFTLGDLEERLLPYRDVRREMADSGPDGFETNLLRLVSGERGYISTDPALQSACRRALAMPSPTLALVRSWATTTVRLTPGDSAVVDLFPAPTRPAQGSVALPHAPSLSASRSHAPTAAPVPAPAAAPAPATPACRYCACSLPTHRAVTFCPHCGLDLTKRQCPACSTELDAHWRFCVTCGRGNDSPSDAAPA